MRGTDRPPGRRWNIRHNIGKLDNPCEAGVRSGNGIGGFGGASGELAGSIVRVIRTAAAPALMS